PRDDGLRRAPTRSPRPRAFASIYAKRRRENQRAPCRAASAAIWLKLLKERRWRHLRATIDRALHRDPQEPRGRRLRLCSPYLHCRSRKAASDPPLYDAESRKAAILILKSAPTSMEQKDCFPNPSN